VAWSAVSKRHYAHADVREQYKGVEQEERY
jgi:hypothetical protein